MSFRPTLNWQRLLATVILCTSVMTQPSVAADTLTGTLDWAGLTRLSLPVSGVVQRVAVAPGQIVAAGTELLRLDPAPFDDRLAAASAERSALTRAAAEAKRDAERTQQLFDRTVASESEVQTALIAQEKAAAQVARSQASTRLRGWEKSQSTLKAPFAARIINVLTAPGETVSAELAPTPLITVAQADHLDAVARLTPQQAATLSLGQTVRARVGEGASQKTTQGKVIAISNPPGNAAPEYLLRVRLAAEPNWVAGLPVQLSLPE